MKVDRTKNGDPEAIMLMEENAGGFCRRADHTPA